MYHKLFATVESLYVVDVNRFVLMLYRHQVDNVGMVFVCFLIFFAKTITGYQFAEVRLTIKFR